MVMSNSKEYILSVRLMTYNHSKYILQAMQSIDSQQTNFDFEVLVGDDFSTDGNMDIIRSFNSTNPRAHWKIIERTEGDSYHVERQKNGRAQNFYDILKKCNGKYIALLDGDDYWTDDSKLQRQVDLLESDTQAIGCFHNSTVVDDNDKVKWDRYFEGKDGARYDQEDSVYTLRSAYSTGSLVFRDTAIRSQLEEFLKIGTDFILEVLITNHGDLVFMDRNMSAYRFHEGGVWQGNTEFKNKLEIVNRYLFLYNREPYRSRYGKFLWEQIMEIYNELLGKAKEESQKKDLNRRIKSFLNYSELRTYKYLFSRLRRSLYYRKKRLLKLFK